VETPLEVVVSAVLVKLSRWSSALKALERVREEGLLDLGRLSSADPGRLSEVIRGVGFPRSKAETIVELARYIVSRGGFEALRGYSVELLRRELLRINGVGRETADSILLFALNKPVFPAARLSKRVLERFCGTELEGYEAVRASIERALAGDLYSLKLLHAGLTTVASRYCRNRNPKCGECILGESCSYRKTQIPGGGGQSTLQGPQRSGGS